MHKLIPVTVVSALVLAVVAEAVALSGQSRSLTSVAQPPSFAPSASDPPSASPSMASSLPVFGKAPELRGTGEWFNSVPLTMEGLRGKVVLVDFWTYTCYNCVNTLPAVKGYWEKYGDTGKFVILGVHTPEFPHEKLADNVRRFIEDNDLRYPVVQDNDYATWKAYNNRYWPAFYLVDAEGNIRYKHFGEGEYDTMDENISALIEEAQS